LGCSGSAPLGAAKSPARGHRNATETDVGAFSVWAATYPAGTIPPRAQPSDISSFFPQFASLPLRQFKDIGTASCYRNKSAVRALCRMTSGEGGVVPDEYQAQAEGDYRTPTPEDYRANAADCLRMMQLATNAEVRAALLLMAQSWNQLADPVDPTGGQKA
jgi:hypothetical protein